MLLLFVHLTGFYYNFKLLFLQANKSLYALEIFPKMPPKGV